MRKHHPANERIKRDYRVYLEQAKGMAPSSVDQAEAAIAQFEASTRFKDFRSFHRNQAIAFKEQLHSQLNPKTGRGLAAATVHSRLMAVREFVIWLAGRPGFRSKINYQDAEYFRTSANEERVARASRTRPVATLGQIRTAFDAMPSDTLIERRDRAVLAATLVSGARDNALASFSLKHVDVDRKTVFHDAREVRSKNAKTFTSNFFPVEEVYVTALTDWIGELTSQGYGPDDPLFPATQVAPGPDRRFVPVGLKRSHWKNADAIRRIFKAAFERVDLPYFHPHTFRHTLARDGEMRCTTAEEWRAYSQNFGHSSPMTTFTSYGEVPPHRQAEIIGGLARAKPAPKPPPGDDAELPDQVRDFLEQMLRSKPKND